MVDALVRIGQVTYHMLGRLVVFDSQLLVPALAFKGKTHLLKLGWPWVCEGGIGFEPGGGLPAGGGGSDCDGFEEDCGDA